MWLDPIHLTTLLDMLHRHHPAVRLYRQAIHLMQDISPDQNCCIALCFDSATDRRRYQNPAEDVQEISVILPGDGETPAETQDIILYKKHGNGLQRIADNHPFYPSLCYVLLFPTGQLGWHSYIPYVERVEGGSGKKEHVSL
jgi:hypothetical protein